jgi:Cleft lip and palate transmembrane protein 1 (CLPTM1)
MFNIKEMCRMMLIFVVMQNAMGFFFGKNAEPTDLQKMQANGTIAPGEALPRFVSHSHLQNFLKAGEPFEVDVYLSLKNHAAFFKKGGINNKQPDWSESGLFYDFSASNERHMNLTIPVTESFYSKNYSLYLHFQATIKNPFFVEDSKELFDRTGIALPKYDRYLKVNQSINLMRYMPRIKESAKRNLLSDDMPQPKAKEEVASLDEDDGKFL